MNTATVSIVSATNYSYKMWPSAPGVSREDYKSYSVEKSVKTFIKAVTPLYFPIDQHTAKHAPQFKEQTSALSKAAIAAGAITATELMAVEEFKALQIAFNNLICRTIFGLIMCKLKKNILATQLL
jgi:hypothetical protein